MAAVPGTANGAPASARTAVPPAADPHDPEPQPGVVVVGASGSRVCAALCTQTINTWDSLDDDDWEIEHQQACVIPDSATGHNQPCTTGAPPKPAPPKPGVVVAGVAQLQACVPLCTFYTDPTLDPEWDGWAYEDSSPCVIPDTAPAVTNLPCITGRALPRPLPRPGVVVGDGDTRRCVATCRYFTSAFQEGADNDGLHDDWAFEQNDACILPGTLTERASQPCATLAVLPKPLERPGILINGDPLEDSCAENTCVPLCQVVETPADPAYPDWGWEYAASCLLPGAISERTGGAPPRACTFGVPSPDFFVPPVTLKRTKRPTFYTDGSTLRDPYGAEFLVRGVNNPHGWYDPCGQYAALGALDAIAASGANTVRVGWAFESIDPGGPNEGEDEKTVIGTTPRLLAEILHRIVELKMIPLVAFNDSTGQTDSSWPNRMAHWITAPGYLELFKAYEPFLLLGIANEWNGTDFATAYAPAITTLRDAGLRMPLVVTGNAWGQGCKPILHDAHALTHWDPLQNLVFDLHIYTYITYPLAGASNPGSGGEAPRVAACLDEIASQSIPLIVGEFGQTHSSGPVAWETIIARAEANRQGYVPWAWYGDAEYPQLNMNDTWSGPRNAWGRNAIAGFAQSSKRATIFR